MEGRVLVVGAGIAGVALARALHRKGVPAVVVERLGGPPDAGLALNLPGNAIQALGALGLGDVLKEMGTPTRRREYRNPRGRLVFSVDEDEFWGLAARPRCVRRVDLLERLGDGLPDGTIRWNTAVTSLAPAGEGVEVGFADGTSSTWELVVGADGVRSAVRGAAFGAAATRAALLSAASWRFMAPDPGVDCWVVWTGARATLLLIPVDKGEVYGYASATRGGQVDADPEWLRSTFAGFPEPVPGVVKAALEQPGSLYHSPVEEVRVPEWSRGRIVVVGDAAHATAPVWAQGAALAVEDALVLAELLATREDWGTVGAEYEQRRRARVEHVQAMTDRLSKAARIPPWIRDRIVPLIGPRAYRETFEPLKEPVV